MSSRSGVALRYGLVPIALAICALMILPASATWASVQGTPHGTGSPATAMASSPTLPTGAPPAGAASVSSASASSSSVLATLAARSAPASATPTKTWLQNLLEPAQSRTLLPLASYPNLNLLEHPESDVASEVSPGYVAQPAPMGIADYGLGTAPYTYSPSHFLGSVTLASPPNVTDPGSQSVIDPGAASLGYVGSVYEFGVQLNTVVTNVSLPGTNDGVFWTQNVLNVNATGIHFVQDIFNFTTSTAYIPAGPNGNASILSGCGQTNLTAMLTVYGGVYQCVGGTVPISPSDYPLTIDLYNNATVSRQNDSEVTFAAEISGATGVLASGTIDSVVFHSPNATTAPPPDPIGFTVSGTHVNPVGLLYDSELDLVGSIGGANAVFRSLSGSMSLEYTNSTAASSFRSVPSAYNFGSDTGETSTGISGYWTAAGVEEINQGPSFLYGLWGAIPRVSVASGDIQFSGTVTPGFGFVFVSNTAPNAIGSNFTWVPSTSAGTFDSYLPPSVPPSSQYYLQVFAPGYKELNGTPFSATTVATFALSASSGTLNAPLYMQGNAQAAAVSTAVSGATAYPTFSGLVVNMNYTFNHLNDYGFPSFVVFSAEDVTSELLVNNVSQGRDSPTGNYYITDGAPYPPGSTGFLVPAPLISPSLENYSDQFQIFDSQSTLVTNETVVGNTWFHSDQGGSVFVWNSQDVVVLHTTVGPGPNGSYGGVFVGDSQSTTVEYLNTTGASIGVDDVGSSGTAVTDVNAAGRGSFGIYALSSDDGVYEYLNATDGAVGIYAGGYTGFPDNYTVPGIQGASIDSVHASGGSLTYPSNGSTLFDSSEVSQTDLYGEDNGVATEVFLSILVDSSGLYLNNPTGQIGAAYEVSGLSEVENVYVSGAGIGVYLYGDEAMYGYSAFSPGPQTLTFYVQASTSVELEQVEYALVTGATTYGLVENYGIVLVDVFGVDVVDSTATNESVAVVVEDSEEVNVTGVTATNRSVGVFLYDDTEFASVSGVSASDSSIGVYTYYALLDSITNVTATNETLGTVLGELPEYSYPQVYSVTDLTPSAVYTEYSSDIVITDVNATNYPVAVSDYYSGYCWDWYEGFCDDSYSPTTDGIFVQGVSASNDTAAVYGEGTSNSSFSEVDATATFVGGLLADGAFDSFSGGSFVNCTTYAIILEEERDGLVWGNSFIGNNGATTTYSATHIQAADIGGSNDQWYLCVPDGSCSGNYWADWHTTLPSGALAPYLVGGDTYDYYPLGYPAGEASVTFTETGLVSGTSWSVTFDGVTETSTASQIVFGAVPGTYAFSVTVPTGYMATPAKGTLDVGSTGASASIAFAETFTVTLTETGLPKGTTWTAIFGGTTGTSATSTMTFTVPAGEYAYQIGSVSGYAPATASGSVTVTGPYAVAVTYQSTSTTSLASTSDLNTYFAVAIAIAVLALAVALVAALMRPRSRKPAPPPPAAAWVPPSAAGGAAASGGAANAGATVPGGTSGDSPSWSEGTGPASPPPS